MQSKVFEVRDRMTFIPVLATLLKFDYSKENYLLRRAGYRSFVPVIILSKLMGDSPETHDDPEVWTDRTMKTAHKYIFENFGQLDHGAVIDVEYILGETTQPKLSENE